MRRILITGSMGLVGTAVLNQLGRDWEPIEFDIAAYDKVMRGDVTNLHDIRQKIKGCCGVLHLAAVSRVIWGEQNPAQCIRTNIGGVKNIIHVAKEQEQPPWIIFASSREVYGQPDTLPTSEDSEYRPVNVYGRTKVKAEQLIINAQKDGLNTAIMRLSNVYGSTNDHADRVLPAFCRAAAMGESLRVDGRNHTFDFTHVDDTARGILSLIDFMEMEQESPPPVHFLTGVPTTLGEASQMAVDIANSKSSIDEAPPRSYDVSRFYGNPSRAKTLLGWEAIIPVKQGLSRLIQDFSSELCTAKEVAL
jgi:UDP-glucose 4-epimerase